MKIKIIKSGKRIVILPKSYWCAEVAANCVSIGTIGKDYGVSVYGADSWRGFVATVKAADKAFRGQS